MNYHLVILKKLYLDAILAGRKTVESRFYQTNQKWLSQVSPGDKLFLKVTSGPVIATATIDKVQIFNDLTPGKITELKNQFNDKILGDDQYWNQKQNSRFGILIKLKDVQSISPIFIKKFDWRAWVVLSKNDSFSLIDSL